MRLAYTLLFLFCFCGVANAQDRITGRVADPQGKPVANTEVLLHAVEQSSGNQIDKDTTRADGSFELTVKTVDPKAVYFVAVLWNGQLYIGDMMRAPFPVDQEYIVQVGVNPVDLGPAATGAEAAPPPAPASRTAGIIVVLVATAVIVGVLLFALRRRPPARRRWLVELARVEAELAAHPEADGPLQKRRTELRTRLRGAQSG